MTIIYSIVTALCLCIGFYFGFFLGKNGNLPKIKKDKKSKEKKKLQQKEDEKINKLYQALNNLDSYDGKSESQEEII